MTTSLLRDTFCSFCGTRFAPPLAYPRTCPGCSTTVWANPIPVSVVLVPIRRAGDEGLLVVRRSIEPKKGLLALTGGFLEEHETWQEGGAREVWEETQVRIAPTGLSPLWFTSTSPRPNRVLLFSVSTPVEVSALTPFVPSNETSERGLVFGADGLDSLFAFDLHVEAVRRYFAERGRASAPHRYEQV